MSPLLKSLPNILTYSRIIAIPVVVGLFFIPGPVGSWLAFSFYTYACVTDFFDGWLARLWHQQTVLGQFLDPIADKLLVAGVIFALVGADRIGGFTLIPAAIILCREIMVSGMREVLADVRVSIPVSQLAKYKTTTQMLALGFLLVGPDGPLLWGVEPLLIGIIGLWIAALFTVITAADYLIRGLEHIQVRDDNNHSDTP